MPDEEAAFGPDITFELGESGGTCEYWALISATDGSGIAVDGVREGDVLRIIDASGICSFSKGKAGLVRSIVTVATEVAGAAVGGAGLWKKATDLMRGELNKHGDNESRGAKRRDAFGQEIGGDGNVAEEEGGLIICLPPATGMVYSSNKVRRDDPTKKPPAGAFFPARGDRPKTMPSDGVIRIGVFDSNFKDNAGCYEIKFSLTRGGGNA